MQVIDFIEALYEGENFMSQKNLKFICAIVRVGGEERKQFLRKINGYLEVIIVSKNR
jgi:hypothetical protein